MGESQLEKELEQAEEVYDGLVQTRGSLGTMLAETIRKGKSLEEFGRYLRDLRQLIWQADLRRTELKHELWDGRAKQAEDEYRRAAEEVSKAARALKQARRAYIKAEETAERCALEARQLAELRDKEAKHLQELRRISQDAQRHQGEHQREEMRGGGQGAQKHCQQGEERAHDPSQAHDGNERATSGASIAGGDANRRSAR
jgi:wyosine [tRNA(Phe)-imidazoG37] synthetase (radical SAM superfamily)